jgi:PKD repeat protein
MNAARTATAHYIHIAGQPLTVSISPMAATTSVGIGVPFTSTVGGGTAPYTYQWYLDGNPVSGATSTSWTFTPPGVGIYYMYLRVTDANGTTAQSGTSPITVIQPPTGGYSISLAKQTPTSYLVAYGALIALFGATLSLKKRKRK